MADRFDAIVSRLFAAVSSLKRDANAALTAANGESNHPLRGQPNSLRFFRGVQTDRTLAAPIAVNPITSTPGKVHPRHRGALSNLKARRCDTMSPLPASRLHPGAKG